MTGSSHMLWLIHACSPSGRDLAPGPLKCGIKLEEWTCRMGWPGADYSQLHMAFRPAAAICHKISLPRSRAALKHKQKPAWSPRSPQMEAALIIISLPLVCSATHDCPPAAGAQSHVGLQQGRRQRRQMWWSHTVMGKAVELLKAA